MYYNVLILKIGALQRMIYQSREQLIIEFKKLLLEKQTNQREVAQRLNITPQALTKILNKQNFSFDDMQKLLSAIGCKLLVDFLPVDENAADEKIERDNLL